MRGYRLYPRANAYQDRIWRDTAKMWGEQQADAYLSGLHEHFSKLSQSRSMWRPLSTKLRITAPGPLAWCSRYQHHLVFFREFSDGQIGVIAILHERMDLPARLQEDLLRISRRDTGEL